MADHCGAADTAGRCGGTKTWQHVDDEADHVWIATSEL
jgi:hypothetical protein